MAVAASLAVNTDTNDTSQKPFKLRHFLKQLNDDAVQIQVSALKRFFELGRPQKQTASKDSTPVETFTGGKPRRDILTKYVESSPECRELFTMLNDLSRGNTSELSFSLLQAFSVILWRGKEHRTTAAIVTKQLLRDHTKRFFNNIDCHSPRLIKATLQLLGAIASQGPLQARQLQQRWNFDYKPFLNLAMKPSAKGRRGKKGSKQMKQSPKMNHGGIDMGVRTAFVRLVISMLRSGATDVIRSTIRRKGFVDGALKGLGTDPDGLVTEVIKCLRDCVLGPNSRAIGRRSLRELLSPTRLGYVIRLSGRNELKRRLSKNFLFSIFSVSTMDIFYKTSDSYKNTPSIPKTSLLEKNATSISSDLYKTQAPLMRILCQFNPIEYPIHLEILLHILRIENSLIAPYMQQLKFSCDPRLSNSWISNMSLSVHLLECPVSLPNLQKLSNVILLPLDDSKNIETSEIINEVVTKMVHVVIPAPITRVSLSHGIQHVEEMIQLTSLSVIAAILKQSMRVVQYISSQYKSSNRTHSIIENIIRQFHFQLQTFLPDPKTIVSLIQRASKMTVAGPSGPLESNTNNPKESNTNNPKESNKKNNCVTKTNPYTVFERLIHVMYHYYVCIPNSVENVRIDWRRLIYVDDKKSRKAGLSGNQLKKLLDYPNVFEEVLRLLLVIGPERGRLMEMEVLSDNNNGKCCNSFNCIAILMEFLTSGQISETASQLIQKILTISMYSTGIFPQGQHLANSISKHTYQTSYLTNFEFEKTEIEPGVWLNEMHSDNIVLVIALLRLIIINPLCGVIALSSEMAGSMSNKTEKRNILEVSPIAASAIAAATGLVDLQLKLESNSLCNFKSSTNESDLRMNEPKQCEIAYISRCLLHIIMSQSSLIKSHAICHAISCGLSVTMHSKRSSTNHFLEYLFALLSIARDTLGWIPTDVSMISTFKAPKVDMIQEIDLDVSSQMIQFVYATPASEDNMYIDRSSECFTILFMRALSSNKEKDIICKNILDKIPSMNTSKLYSGCNQIILHLSAMFSSNKTLEKTMMSRETDGKDQVQFCFDILRALLHQFSVYDKENNTKEVLSAFRYVFNLASMNREIIESFASTPSGVKCTMTVSLGINIVAIGQLMATFCTTEETASALGKFIERASAVLCNDLDNKIDTFPNSAVSLLAWHSYVSGLERQILVTRILKKVISLTQGKHTKQYSDELFSGLLELLSQLILLAPAQHKDEQIELNADTCNTLLLLLKMPNLSDTQKETIENLILYLLGGMKGVSKSVYDVVSYGFGKVAFMGDFASAISEENFQYCLQSNDCTLLKVCAFLVEFCPDKCEMFERYLISKATSIAEKDVSILNNDSLLILPVVVSFMKRALLCQSAVKHPKSNSDTTIVTVATIARMNGGIEAVNLLYGNLMSDIFNEASTVSVENEMAASQIVQMLQSIIDISKSVDQKRITTKNKPEYVEGIEKNIKDVLNTIIKRPTPWSFTQMKLAIVLLTRAAEDTAIDTMSTNLPSKHIIVVRLLEEIAKCFRKTESESVVDISMENQLIQLMFHFLPRKLPIAAAEIAQVCIRRTLRKRFTSRYALQVVARLTRSAARAKSVGFDVGMVLATLAAHPKFKGTLILSMDSNIDDMSPEQLNTFNSARSAQLALVELLKALYVIDSKVCCQPQLLPLLLMAYNASLSRKDRLLLQIFRLYDKCGISLASVGYAWSQAMISRRKLQVESGKSSVSQLNQSYEWFYSGTVIEPFRIEKSISYFPFNRGIQSDTKIWDDYRSYWHDSVVVCDDDKVNETLDGIVPVSEESSEESSSDDTDDKNDQEKKEKYEKSVDIQLNQRNTNVEMRDVSNKTLHMVYDPAFMFPMMIHLCADSEIQVRKFIDIGALGYIIMGMSSEVENVRRLAYELAGRIIVVMETAEFRERPQIKVLLSCLRAGVKIQFARLPALTCAFVAEAASVLLRPSHSLYNQLNGFLLARPELDCTDVPMFYSTFCSGNPGHHSERLWILRLLNRGVQSAIDVNVLSRRHVLSVIMDFCSSGISSSTHVINIAFNVLQRACEIPRAAQLLYHRDGFVPWLSSCCASKLRHSTISSLNKGHSKDIIWSSFLQRIISMTMTLVQTLSRSDEQMTPLICIELWLHTRNILKSTNGENDAIKALVVHGIVKLMSTILKIFKSLENSSAHQHLLCLTSIEAKILITFDKSMNDEMKSETIVESCELLDIITYTISPSNNMDVLALCETQSLGFIMCWMSRLLLQLSEYCDKTFDADYVSLFSICLNWFTRHLLPSQNVGNLLLDILLEDCRQCTSPFIKMYSRGICPWMLRTSDKKIVSLISEISNIEHKISKQCKSIETECESIEMECEMLNFVPNKKKLKYFSKIHSSKRKMRVQILIAFGVALMSFT